MVRSIVDHLELAHLANTEGSPCGLNMLMNTFRDNLAALHVLRVRSMSLLTKVLVNLLPKQYRLAGRIVTSLARVGWAQLLLLVSNLILGAIIRPGRPGLPFSCGLGRNTYLRAHRAKSTRRLQWPLHDAVPSRSGDQVQKDVESHHSSGPDSDHAAMAALRRRNRRRRPALLLDVLL